MKEIDELVNEYEYKQPGQEMHVRGFLYLTRKNYDEAIEYFDKAIAEVIEAGDKPGEAYMMHEKAIACYYSGDLNTAWKLFEESEKINKNSYQASLFNLNFLSTEAELYEKAIEKAGSIIDFVTRKEFYEMNDHFSSDFYLANAYANMGLCYARLGMLFQAEKKFILFMKLNKQGIVNNADVHLCKFLIEKKRCTHLAKEHIQHLINCSERSTVETRRSKDSLNYLKKLLEM